MRRPLLVALVASALGVPVGSFAANPNPQSRLRPMDRHAAQVLQLALRDSPTVRSLVERVEASDLIVYVRFGTLPSGVTGTTRLHAATSATRFLIVTIHPMASPSDLVGTLGHELQHVVEIGDAPWVRDDPAMRALLARIGWRSGPDKWETMAAVDAGHRVAREVSVRSAPAFTGD